MYSSPKLELLFRDILWSKEVEIKTLPPTCYTHIYTHTQTRAHRHTPISSVQTCSLEHVVTNMI